jgi:hypothetical protein
LSIERTTRAILRIRLTRGPAPALDAELAAIIEKRRTIERAGWLTATEPLQDT